MSIAQAMLVEFEHEAATTRKFLERVPQEKLTWRPHEKSHSAGELALHIASVPKGVLQSALKDQSELPDFNTLFVAPKTVTEILAALDQSIDFVRKELPKLDDAMLQKMWSGTVQGKVVLTMPRVAFIRFIMLNHWIHHRGQLGVYLRLMGARVPSSYGPSADES